MRKGGRYNSGHDPVEGDRQLTIRFEQWPMLTAQMLKDSCDIFGGMSVTPLNGEYILYVHPEMLKDQIALDILSGKGSIEAGGTDAKVSDTDIGSMLDSAPDGTGYSDTPYYYEDPDDD